MLRQISLASVVLAVAAVGIVGTLGGCAAAPENQVGAATPTFNAQQYLNDKGHVQLAKYWETLPGSNVNETSPEIASAPYALTGNVAKQPFNAQNYTDDKGHVHPGWYYSGQPAK